jgi:hypothetical protein
MAIRDEGKSDFLGSRTSVLSPEADFKTNPTVDAPLLSHLIAQNGSNLSSYVNQEYVLACIRHIEFKPSHHKSKHGIPTIKAQISG